MPSKSILITRPNHDLINSYFFIWTEDVIFQANRHGIKVLDLNGSKATKDNFTSYIVKHDPKFIFMNGHGNENCIAGHENKIIIENGINESILVGKIAYCRSCNVAASLGDAAIKRGAKAFIGYLKKYSLGYTPSLINHPRKDTVAKLFLDPSNLIPISLLKGNSVKQAFEKSQEAMKRNIRFMLSTKATKEQRDAIPSLWRNKKYQTLMGDENARI